jgi:Ubiquitin-activating enzyme E1 FCCH domain/Baseplate J-like protein
MATFPIVMSETGYVPQAPTTLQAQLIANVSATNPGYTANLPGSLVEDVSSTDVFAMLQMDSSIAEIIDSVTPYGANAYLLNQLGTIYGTQPQAATNTSVYVQFSGPAGYFIPNGFTVSDGSNQYVVQDGVSIGSGGLSPLVLAIADVTGEWAVPANTVNQIVTSIPSTVMPTPTVNNPQAGTPAAAVETEEGYRARTLQAGLASSQGMTRYLKTLVQNVPGVQANLVSARIVTYNSVNYWEIIVGGSGDPYAIGNAIFQSMFDLPDLIGSVLQVSGASNANPAVITTNLNHGYSVGQIVTFSGMTGGAWPFLNGSSQPIIVLSQTTFSIPFDSTGFGPYTGGGVLTPNARNIVVSVQDYPDTYNITFVNPPQQTVAMTVTWNTFSTNYVNPASVAQLALNDLITYINAIPVGQPINVMVLNTTFQNSVSSVIPPQLLTRLVFAISINGVGVSPEAGTYEIMGDVESYFYTDSSLVSIDQG